MAGVQLVITLDQATGQVSVNGPLDDRMLCYGLLEMAREAISQRAQKPRPGIVPVTFGMGGQGHIAS